MTAMLIKKITVEQIEIPDLGQRIKEARSRSPKSMEQLCREAGFSRTYWYDIENNFIKGGISIETIRKMESVLETDFGIDL